MPYKPEERTCPKCGKKYITYYKHKHCSSHCANKRKHSEESKKKASIAYKKFYQTDEGELNRWKKERAFEPGVGTLPYKDTSFEKTAEVVDYVEFYYMIPPEEEEPNNFISDNDVWFIEE